MRTSVRKRYLLSLDAALCEPGCAVVVIDAFLVCTGPLLKIDVFFELSKPIRGPNLPYAESEVKVEPVLRLPALGVQYIGDRRR